MPQHVGFPPPAHSYAYFKVQALLLRRAPCSSPPWKISGISLLPGLCCTPSTHHSRQQRYGFMCHIPLSHIQAPIHPEHPALAWHPELMSPAEFCPHFPVGAWCPPFLRPLLRGSGWGRPRGGCHSAGSWVVCLLRDLTFLSVKWDSNFCCPLARRQ